jgi:mannose-6-phosphate isomerase
MNEPLFLKPVFKERIWGGKALCEKFNYDVPLNNTGECWGISAHPNGSSEVVNGPLKGKKLNEVWKTERQLFANQTCEQFPLLVKILDAKEDLSVQVHPNDEQATLLENYPYGKTECWYILDCEEGAEIIFGHYAKSEEDFVQMIEEGSWNNLLRKVQVKPGDFIYVPSGTIHAIGKGIQILETQQSSDITYRVYDYNRRDSEGELRELHLEESIQVTNIPHINYQFEVVEEVKDGMQIQKLIEENFFTVYHWKLNGSISFEGMQKYLLVSVVEGEGILTSSKDHFPFKKGDHFIIPSTMSHYELSGTADCIVSHPSNL